MKRKTKKKVNEVIYFHYWLKLYKQLKALSAGKYFTQYMF